MTNAPADEPLKGVKLTVMLTDDNWRAAEAAAAHEGDTVTDSINRALAFYYAGMTCQRWQMLKIIDRFDGKIMRWLRVS